MAATPPPAAAETLSEALARAFERNPALNAQRANVLATRENIPRAAAGMRARVAATADAGYRNTYEVSGSDNSRATSNSRPYGYGLQATQPVFDGFKTKYAVGQAVSQDLGAREALRNTEQATVLDAVKAYVETLTSRSLITLNRLHVAALIKQLGQVRGLHSFGDVTRTDVVQVEARLAAARAQVSFAEAALSASAAVYEQVIGVVPVRLAAARGVDKLVPRSQEAAMQLALEQHPAIQAALHGVDAAHLQVGITRSELLPRIDLSGGATHRFQDQVHGDERFDATVMAQVKIPLYDGGDVRARTSQARHATTQRRLEADQIRDQVRAAIFTSFGQLLSAKARMITAQAQVTAAETALHGIREEYLMGLRTSYDVLNAEQDLLNARIGQVVARRDRVLASYTVARAAGTLDFAAYEDAIRLASPDQAVVSETLPPRGRSHSASTTVLIKTKTKAGNKSASSKSIVGVSEQALRPSLME